MAGSNGTKPPPEVPDEAVKRVGRRGGPIRPRRSTERDQLARLVAALLDAGATFTIEIAGLKLTARR